MYLLSMFVGLFGCESEKNGTQVPPVDTAVEDTSSTDVIQIEELQDLVASSPFGQRVNLNWKDISEDEDGYRVSRSCTLEEGADDDGFCALIELEANTEAYQDNSASSDQLYNYRVTVYADQAELSVDVAVHTPPTMETMIQPRPQEAWFLGEEGQTMVMPSHVNIDSNIEFETLRLLLREADPYSLPARLVAAGMEISTEPLLETAATDELQLFFHQIDGPEVSSLTEGLVTFEEMGEEGFVILVEPSGAGQRMTVSANTAEGLYRGGMASLGLLIDDENASLYASLEHMIVLDYPDHSVRSYYDTPNSGALNDEETGLDPEVIAHLDEMSRSGANLAFHQNYAFAPMQESFLQVSWEEKLEEIRYFEAAAQDRFIEIVAEVGETHASPSRFPNSYAYVDGLGVQEEPFVLEEQPNGVYHAVAESPVRQLVSDWEMSDESAWTNPTSEGCTNWTYDPIVGHHTPGSWRLDADGDGSCSSLRIQLDETDIVDGRYLLSSRIRIDSDSEYLGPFGGNAGQVTLVVRYDEGSPNESSLSLNERSISIGSLIGYLDPTKANNDGSTEWFELYTTVVIDGLSQGKTITSVEIYSRSMGGTGTYWMDELSLERIDGSLWNVVGGVEPPLVTSRDRSITYEEGVDYTVCQIGEAGSSGNPTETCSDAPDQANYKTVYNIRSPGGTIKFGFEPRFSRDLDPFEFRWLDGGSWPDNGELLISYDINLPYQGQYSSSSPGQDYISQRLNFCDFDTVFESIAWADAFERILGSNDGQMGATNIRLGLSEARGLNRSRICFERLEENGNSSWVPIESNAALFATVANRLIDEALEQNPDATLYFWDDMFSPFFNGGNAAYQFGFGGQMGPTACALGAETLPLLCNGVDDVYPIDPRAIMIHWTYYQRGARQTQASAQYYDQTERPWLIGTGGSVRVAEDWASVAKSSTSNIGVSAFLFGNADIPHSLRTFWNHDWRLHYMVDFETEQSSIFQLEAPTFEIHEGEVLTDSAGECASYSSQNTNVWEGNQDGGLCIVSVDQGISGSVSEVASTGGLSYRAGIHLKWRSNGEKAPPLARFVFTLSDGSTEATEWLTTVEEVIERNKDDFDRYETDPTAAQAPINTVGVRLELDIPLGAVAVDNILLWETTPACFDGCSN